MKLLSGEHLFNSSKNIPFLNISKLTKILTTVKTRFQMTVVQQKITF